ncbi:DUF1345 domain-containing protein [Limnohabitans sp.]|uniref:DUF1345 domain-containing protein n=1 Tax=Limnohabitans sp. TaxID=1907725 RepID=UPI00286F3874|nr:DUF1345 domain-containing protein [Limnohabitans sp.]
MMRLPAIAHAFLVRPRFLIAIAMGLGSYALLPTQWDLPEITRAIVAWNLGTLLYLLLVAHMMFAATHERMRSRALKQNNGRFLVLCLVILAALFSLAGIVAELSLARQLYGESKLAHMVLVALTVFTTWSFTQVMFALHYAHEYYMAHHDNIAGGLEFPGGHAPDYGDFLYVACVIGTSGQTADVGFSSRNLRRIGLVHCVLAFFFNTTLVALTINIASGLL